MTPNESPVTKQGSPLLPHSGEIAESYPSCRSYRAAAISVLRGGFAGTPSVLVQSGLPKDRPNLSRRASRWQATPGGENTLRAHPSHCRELAQCDGIRSDPALALGALLSRRLHPYGQTHQSPERERRGITRWVPRFRYPMSYKRNGNVVTSIMLPRRGRKDIRRDQGAPPPGPPQRVKEKKGKGLSPRRHTKPDAVEAVVGHAAVAIRGTQVDGDVEPRPAANNAGA